jgi:heterodisulfide reductase subunit C
METAIKRELKFQREADAAWTQRISKLPGCERLTSCTQCGSCSAACPLSIYMDVTPRRLLALVRSGFREEALRSRSIWLCTSCYACASACPQKISVADLMFALKREAIESRIHPKRFAVPVLAREFLKMVRMRGRSSDFWLAARMTLRSHPTAVFGMMATGWQLWRAGRLRLSMEPIHLLQEFQRGSALRETRGEG